MTANRVDSLDRRSSVEMAVSSDRISELRSTFRNLREQGRSVMARLRESMFEMQAQRARLRVRGRDPGAGSAPAPTQSVFDLRRRYGMTPREAGVAMLLAEECSNATIAQRLGISVHTARHHTQRVLAKLGVRSRAEAGVRLRP